MRTDDATKDYKETATAFNVSQTIAITRERSFSLLIHESKSKRTWLEAYIEAVSFRRIATVKLEYTDRQTDTHTHNQLYSIPPAAIVSWIVWQITHELLVQRSKWLFALISG